MNDFKEKLYRFMSGRYGFDQFSRFLMTAGLIMAVLCMFLRFLPFRSIYYICSFLNTFFYIFAVFRILSRNTYKRTLENEKYLRIRNKVMPFFDEKTKSIRDRNYIYKKCPKCSAKLRLKRIKGKHITKCPKCGLKFNVRIFIEYKNKYPDMGPY
ncbi:MAG: hypothetical protein IKL10_02785 [Clostridia bacterium]|nr:hypothetical protein [Clostridia bacterium]